LKISAEATGLIEECLNCGNFRRHTGLHAHCDGVVQGEQDLETDPYSDIDTFIHEKQNERTSGIIPTDCTHSSAHSLAVNRAVGVIVEEQEFADTTGRCQLCRRLEPFGSQRTAYNSRSKSATANYTCGSVQSTAPVGVVFGMIVSCHVSGLRPASPGT